MNIQLANALSDISGVSGDQRRRTMPTLSRIRDHAAALMVTIIGAILGGERDPYRLADLRDKRVKASREEVARSLLTTGAAA